MSAKTKRKARTKAKPRKARLSAGELHRMVQKIAALDRAVGKINAGIEGLEKQIRMITIALVCTILAVGYVSYVKADAPDHAQSFAAKRR